ncbi:autotransporter-associated beta strand repeat-containing protein [Luteolibacter arcticus]|uniref:Autotransporter-associated beta strand repeat-containing protein n=1 Tax=Luteolibacter arcticus TaxID=1581411 RepID=A0ABT3GQN4_9BACT|nr:autotransporter-associated beta strand repeat-containing protein [Luteolibacter arcticus]MCW1925790.1 autotransporter-associated beta strand repeat-containing protein [Luteolibacter arcticus]
MNTCTVSSRSALLATALALGPAMLSLSASAAVRTWSGNADANLSTLTNWEAGAGPAPVSGDSWTFAAAGTAGATLTNDLATSSAFEVAGITFTAAATTSYTIGSGTIGLTGNIVMAGGANNQTIASNIAVSGARQLNLNVGNVAAGNLTLNGNLTGNGTLTQTAGNGGARGVTFNGDNSGFTGTFTQTNDGNNRTSFNTATSGSASAAWVLNRDVAGGIALNLGLGTLHFGSLAGGAQIRNNAAATTTVSVGALNTNTTFNGGFRSNTGGTNVALTKVGTGTLTLSGSNLHTAATTVQGGTLEISSSGSMPNSAVAVNSTGTLKVADGKTLNAVAVNAGGLLDPTGNLTVTNAASATGANATIDLINGAASSMLNVGGATGMTLGGASGADTATLNVEVGGVTCDTLNIFNGLAVDAGGVSITVTNLGVQAGQSYILASFSSGSGAGFATGMGTTVGAVTLANHSLAFGVSGSLEVTATSIILHTSGATPPATAYWSGTKGSNWSDNTAGQGNFTTSAAGATFINTSPGAGTQVYFNNNAPTNLTHTLGGNFDILGLTYRGSSAAVTTSGTHLLALQSGGITVESGNGGATLAMSTLQIAADQTWSNSSSNPLTVSASSITGPTSILTMAGSGGVHLGGTSFSVGTLALNTNLDVKGTAVSAGFMDSAGNITNTVAANATVTVQGDFPTTLSGVISDSGPGALVSITKTGAELLLLSGANSYGGTTTLAGGTLQAGTNSAFGTGTLHIGSAAATLDLNGKAIANLLTNAGGGGTITNSSATEAKVTAGFNPAADAGFVISDFTIHGTGDIRWEGALRRTNGGGTVVKSGANTLTIDEAAGIATVGGMSLRVEEGTVVYGKTTHAGFNNITLNGGTLRMDPTYQLAASPQVWNGAFGNEAIINGGVWDLNDTGTNGINNRLKRVSGTGGTITNSGTGASQLVLAARDTAAPVWAGNIEDGGNGGTVALTIQWGGSVNQVMQFSGLHTYSGDTYIRENVMSAGAANVFSPNSHFIIPNHSIGGKLDLNGFDNTIGSLAGDEPDGQVLLGSATLTTGGKGDASTTFAGVISGTGGLIKSGGGTFTITGANTYSGDTVVNAGILAVDGDSLLDAGKLVIASGAKVDVIGTEVVGTLFFAGVQQDDGTWGATGSGAAHIDDVRFSGTGVVHVGAVAGYDSWADDNAGGQTAEQDFDGDGMDNGIEYFMNAAAGFTANPGVVGGAVAWPNGGKIARSAYGTQFVVKTSTNLTTWEPVLETDPKLSNTAGSVSYTLPTGAGKFFVRLEVTPQ